MIIFKVFFILSFLSYSINVFSGTVLPPHPIETIAGGEESCIDSKDSKCKPWVVNIHAKDESGKYIFSCSGSLISPSYVLTAAHCQKSKNVPKKYLILNYKQEKIGTAPYENFVPYSNSKGKIAEFAIIKLDNPIDLANYGHVRRFFNYDEAYEKIDKDYYNASIYGYGNLGIDPTTGNQIRNTEGKQQRADVNIVTDAIDYYKNNGILIKENKDLKSGVAQTGDSGGPVIWHDTIIGVISTGLSALKDNNKSRPFFFASDVTGKYLDNNFIGKRNLGSWFSQNMKRIWIYNPDWGEKLNRRRKSIPVEGFGRPSSEINLRYSIDHKSEENTKCPVDKNGTWKCDIPYDTYFTETVSEGNEYVITITAEEFNKGDASWESDTITAKIPNTKQEFDIIYPSDKSIVLTKNFTIRGYAAPGSEIILSLSANSKYGDEVYTQDKLCAGLNNNELIKTGENGLWSCRINTNIHLKNSGKDNNYYITAEQKKVKDEIISDQVSISLKPEDYSTLDLNLNTIIKRSIYKRMLEFKVDYAKNAKLVCIFDGHLTNCKNNHKDENIFRLYNLIAKKDDLNKNETPSKFVGAIQKLENVDPFDPKLRYSHSFEFGGKYFIPSFNKEYPMESPTKISSTDVQNKKFTGFGGDDQRYTLSNDDIFLPSEYSICMKKSNDSPSNTPQCNSDDKDKNIYVKIPLENGKYFSEIPIKYSDYGERLDFPNWSLSLPSELKDGVYYIEVMDRFLPQGLNIEPRIFYNFLSKAYFEIGPLDVGFTNPANTSDTVTTVSGTASIPGETVNVRKRKLTLSRGASGGDTPDIFPDIICENAVVSDNGDWGCRTPVIFTEGTYELIAELMKDNKVVATKTEVVTVEEKEPEEDEPEIDNPANSPPIDPDGGLISLFGLFSAAAGAAAGLVFDLAGAASGAVLGAVSTIAGLTIPHWGLNIDTSKLHGGEAYKLVIQETKDGKKIGAPIEWHFTMPMRITEPQKNAHYRINSGISIQGEGTPGQLILIASSKLFLPPKETVLPPSSGTLICQTKVDANGKWVCPNNPVMTAKQAGRFSLYAAQYQELHSKDLTTTHYKRTSEVSRQYEITQTRISITAPKQNAEFHRKPFDIAGIGEPGAQIHIGKNGNNKACDTTVTASGTWSCGPYLFGKGKFTVSAEQFISHELHSTAQVSYKIQPAYGASSVNYLHLHFNHHSINIRPYIKRPPCCATITSIEDAQIIPDGKYDISGLVNTQIPNEVKKIKVSISSFDDPDYTHPSEPTKEYTPDVDLNSGTWSLKGLTAKCFNYYKASVFCNQNREEDNNLPGKKEIKFSVARCPVKITKPVMHEFITSTDDNPKQIVIEGKVTEKTPLDVIANYYSNGEHVLPILSRIGNNWQTKISDAPTGFIQIKAKNTGTPNVPIKNSNDEVTILKSKEFSVKYEIVDNVFIHIYGTSLPNNDKKISDFKETIHPKIILSDGVKSEEITPDEKGNWSSDNEYYAKRGVYLFTIHETSDNENYPARKDKTLECTGGNDHMTCIEKNN